MDRRRLIGAMAATPLMAWGGLAHAQAAGRVWHVGFLAQSSLGSSGPNRNFDALREGLRSLG